MAIVEGMEKLMSADARGSFGYSCGFGGIRYGKSLFGFFSTFAGIYQRKTTLAGKRTSRMAFYAPTNPQTVPQQNWRAVFAAGWVAYRTLTAPEKEALSREARKYRLSGPQLYLRRYLQANRL